MSTAATSPTIRLPASAVPSAISLLVIDDNPDTVDRVTKAVAQPGLEVLTASGPEEGLELFRRRRPQIVITDVKMPRLSGMEVLERIMDVDPATDVILMSAYYSAASAIDPVNRGTSDYLNKPILIGSLRARVGKLVEDVRARQRALALEDEAGTDADFEGIIGRSPRMWEMFWRIRRIAPHYRSVLITGETGTGKDLVARAIHRLSQVASGEYVVLNCSAVVETLFESELFGHVKGSFTGATHDKPGLFEHANGGTLFLDEIGDMPLGTQSKLLRVLQNQEVQRVGALRSRKVDVHVVAATNHNLRVAMAENRFREDLYYRLSMVEIQAPRLAERAEDLPLLQQHFIKRFAEQYGKEIRGLTQRAQVRLSQHSWPGNVRELENVIGHAAMMTTTDMLDVPDLPLSFQFCPDTGATAAPSPPSGDTLADVEREHIIHVLRQTGGVVSMTAARLGIPRTTLNALMRRLKISRDDI